MKLTDNDHDKLIKTLKTTYHDQEEVQAGPQWQQNVMRDIRRLGPLKPEANGMAFIDQYMWRAATVICMLILVVSTFVMNLDFMSDFELINLLLTDPFASTSVESFFM